MEATTLDFEDNAHAALENPALQSALAKIKTGWVANRARAADRLPEFEALRDQGRDIKNHSLAHLDLYLQAFEAKVVERGGTRALGARRRRGARHRARAVPGGRRPLGHQEQEHGDRGDRAQRVPRIARHGPDRDRPRRVHPADLRPAAEPHRRPGRAHDQGRDQRPVRPAPWRPAARGGVRPGRRGAPHPAPALSRRPMSASPAPTS